MPVRSIFQKLIVTGVHNDQIGLVLEYFVQDRDKSIACVRDPATIDDFKPSLRFRGMERQFEPRGERGLDRVRAALDGGSTETEDTKLTGRLACQKAIRAKEYLPIFGNLPILAIA
jgi:hypothetical protein